MSTDNKEQSIENLLNKIKDTVSDFDLHSLLKVYSNNFNTELLEVLRSDLKRQLYFHFFRTENVFSEKYQNSKSTKMNSSMKMRHEKNIADLLFIELQYFS